MKKIKSNNQHAPLQFISPYTQVECLDRLEQHFGDTDVKMSFDYVDDTVTEFQIHYKQGSTPLIAYGSLKVWAAGEQTRIICRVVSDKATPTINNFMFEAVASVVGFIVLSILIYLIVPLSSDELLGALVCIGFFMVVSLFSGIVSFFSRSPFVNLFRFSFNIFAFNLFGPFIGEPMTFANQPQAKETSFMERLSRTSAKAESQFYDYLVAVLGEPKM